MSFQMTFEGAKLLQMITTAVQCVFKVFNSFLLTGCFMVTLRLTPLAEKLHIQ